MKNLLPADGEVYYLPSIFTAANSQSYFNKLLSGIAWQNDQVKIFGKHIVTKRKTAWYGDHHYQYKYSGIVKKALAWTDELLKLKDIAELQSGVKFNSCLLNLYHDGSEGMSWHSDDEKEIETDSVIASMSLGAYRRFLFKHKLTGEKIEIGLEDGSLLLMGGTTQRNWLHSLPKSLKVKEPRINLTFRRIAP